MINIFENKIVDAKEVYQYVETKTKFYDWIKRCIDYADLKENVDFFTVVKQNKVGRPTTIYTLTLDAAKEACIVSATSKAKELRRWLIDLSNQRQNLDLFTTDEILMLSALKTFFKYIDNQIEYENKHKDKYVAEYSGNKNAYSEFNIWRNKMLNIEPETINQKIKDFCVENRRRFPKKSISKREKILFLDQYDTLKNAVWDFLKIKGEINAMKIAELVKNMAKVENLQLLRTNEENLFQTKENISLQATDIKQLK